MFKFEEEFDPVQKLSWMEANWLTACYWISLYLFLIYTGQHVMSTRPAFKLRIPLIVWNVALAVFSIIGSIRTLPEMFYGISNFGFDYTVCDSSYMEPNRACSFWSWLFILSKVPELGDTLFLVLRKRNVIFLHWYHHMTVLLFTWYATASYMSTGRWYIYMNYLVHAIMYSYYALTAIGYRLPKPMAMLITTLQIVQMILGCYVTSRAYYLRSHGASCETTTESAQWALLMYSSYFLLFAHFFVKAYFSPKKNVGSKVGKTEDSLNNNSRRKEEIKCD
jgi:hypothetical protein